MRGLRGLRIVLPGGSYNHRECRSNIRGQMCRLRGLRRGLRSGRDLDAKALMTEEGYSAAAVWFASYVNGFRDAGGGLPPALQLKLDHSLRVAADAGRIAAELGRDAGYVRLAEAAGLLHDAGRFVQFRASGNFSEPPTDHGGAGALELAAKARDFCADRGEALLLLDAVRYHNRRTADIPADLGGEAAGLLGIVRDADKLDIMRIALESIERDGFKDLPSMLPGVSLSREITPGTLEKASGGGGLPTASLRTLSDFIIMVLAWFQDLNHPPSFRLALRRGIPESLRAQLPGTPAAERFFKTVMTAAGTAAEEAKWTGKRN